MIHVSLFVDHPEFDDDDEAAAFVVAAVRDQLEVLSKQKKQPKEVGRVWAIYHRIGKKGVSKVVLIEPGNNPGRRSQVLG